ncbi:MAG: hypothetical protein MR902_01430 [Campylobacter sp.]|nr:hypothetical protein [Campylobacter sp.]
MRVFLIDAENVNFELFIKSREFKDDDAFYIVGNETLKFSLYTLKFLQDKRFKIYYFSGADKNYADKIIFTILGAVIGKDEFRRAKFYIVSNDSIFAFLDYTEILFDKKVENIKFTNSLNLTPAKLVSFNKEFDIKNIYKKYEIDIKALKSDNSQMGDLHNALVKKFGMQIGKELYKFIKSGI